MRKPIDIVVLEEEKVNELKPMIFEYLKNGYELVGQIKYSPENAYRCDAYVATMIKYEEREPIIKNEMKTVQEIEIKIKELQLNLQELSLHSTDTADDMENYNNHKLPTYYFVKALEWVLGREDK